LLRFLQAIYEAVYNGVDVQQLLALSRLLHLLLMMVNQAYCTLLKCETACADVLKQQGYAQLSSDVDVIVATSKHWSSDACIGPGSSVYVRVDLYLHHNC